jgi:hypothetical protein
MGDEYERRIRDDERDRRTDDEIEYETMKRFWCTDEPEGDEND